MDGNGRWAVERGLARSLGHRAGIKSVQTIIDAALVRQIDTLTLFAFSSENWNIIKNCYCGISSSFKSDHFIF